MEELILIEPTIKYDKQIQAFRHEFLFPGLSIHGEGSLMRFNNTADWLAYLETYKQPETVPSGRVPATQYIFVRESDLKTVGVIQIRHYLNEANAIHGGHIGYSICTSERHRGYATLMRWQALPKCKDLGLKRVLITCLQDNAGSRKTILNNGGVYESTVYVAETNSFFERYWIEIK